MKNIKKFIPWIIIIVLLFALVVTQCSKQKFKDVNHDQELKAAIQVEKKRVIDLANREQTLKEKLKQDSLKNIKSLIAYKRENTILRQELKKARIPVQEIIDSIPSLDAFVDLQDSLIKHQEGRIEALTIENVTQANNFNQLITVADKKFKASNELVKNFDQLNKELEKRYKRERLRKNGYKIIAGILGVGIVAQSLDVF